MPNSTLSPESPTSESRSSVTTRTSLKRVKILRWLLPLMVIVTGAVIAQFLLNSGPQARIGAPSKQPRLVETASFVPAMSTPMLEAMGTVIAAREGVLYPQVNGTIVAVSDQLIPGGLFHTGDEVLRIDEADYQLSLRQQEAAVDSARAALQEELGQQAVARREYELLGRQLASSDEALVLRKPQLASAHATLKSAEAIRDQSRLELERIRVVAPFGGIVTRRDVDLGTRVTTTTTLLTLVSTEAFWVEVSVPVADLAWINIPDSSGNTGATVALKQASWGKDLSRTGRVLRLIPELDSDSRMARLLVEVPDPLALKPEHAGLPPVLVNDYLRVSITGRPLNNVVALDRNLLRDGDNIWIMSPDDTLEIRPVEVAFRGSDVVYIQAGLSREDRVITADMSTPVEGTEPPCVYTPNRRQRHPWHHPMRHSQHDP